MPVRAVTLLSSPKWTWCRGSAQAHIVLSHMPRGTAHGAPAPRSPRRREVTAQYHPRALRWFLVNTQYRQPINYTQRALEEVRAAWIPLSPMLVVRVLRCLAMLC